MLKQFVSEFYFMLFELLNTCDACMLQIVVIKVIIFVSYLLQFLLHNILSSLFIEVFADYEFHLVWVQCVIEVGAFSRGVGQFGEKYYVEAVCFAPTSIRCSIGNLFYNIFNILCFADSKFLSVKFSRFTESCQMFLLDWFFPSDFPETGYYPPSML